MDQRNGQFIIAKIRLPHNLFALHYPRCNVAFLKTQKQKNDFFVFFGSHGKFGIQAPVCRNLFEIALCLVGIHNASEPYLFLDEDQFPVFISISTQTMLFIFKKRLHICHQCDSTLRFNTFRNSCRSWEGPIFGIYQQWTIHGKQCAKIVACNLLLFFECGFRPDTIRKFQKRGTQHI